MDKTISDLSKLLESLKGDIDNDMMVEGIDEPSIDVTIATDETGENWAFQTGDNSYMGPCYHKQYWGIGTLTRNTDTDQLAEEMVESVLEQIEE